MMAHNLCYTTYVPDRKRAEELGPDKVTRTPDGHYFVKSQYKKGILPIILEELISARK